jgi:hypothetical protein
MRRSIEHLADLACLEVLELSPHEPSVEVNH